MIKNILTAFFSIVIFQFSYSQKNIETDKLIGDFDFAVLKLHSLHQGFYNYEDKYTVDLRINELRDEIKAPMSKLEFYQIIRRLLGIMNEGHGSVDLPKWTMIKAGLSKSFLPLTVKFLGQDLIVNQNYGENIEGVFKGDKLVGINGKTINEIMDKLLPLIPTDGFNETSKYEWIGGVNFTLLYRLIYGKSDIFELELIEPNQNKSKLVKIPAIRFTKFKSKNAKLPVINFSYSNFEYKQVNDSTAYLSIPDFYSKSINFPLFYKESFKTINEQGIEHLIIDIQDNVGGIEGNENLLFHYLTKEVIRKYRAVTMLPVAYDKNKNNEDYKFDKWTSNDSIAVRGEFTCFSDYFSELGYSMPKEEYVFEGKVYVLTSGVTFSGGAEFASLIKMTNRGVFIGEETGGAYEGNVSGYSEIVKLPNTKIKIDIPTVHFQIDVTPEIVGRGIIPDYEVSQTWQDYMSNSNAKLEFTLNLIKNSTEVN